MLTVQPMPYVTRYHETTLAWILAELAADRLPRRLRVQVFASIGAGDVRSAIFRLLESCHRDGVPIPLQMRLSLSNWLDGYAGTEIEAILRPLIDSGGAVTLART
ncbi:hypothetical protein MAIC_40900 [Mycolicibacterium aichiense]|uniref:Uncharacterized protein n=1 Tax=Mycolicibacterium aichiense TaxID=1799 RepID=A0AAD1MCB7_9MYCO|nr:hypothetical protein MAIC_40900 [Mycolicibacterium aichiense]